MANSSATDADTVDVDATYFTSYEDLSVHELMLKDRPRTLAYKEFIAKNAELFKDKIVMDVGAGTGILAMFAARAGAKKVYAVEGSKLSYTCELLVRHNGFGDIIEVVHNMVEDVELPGVKVDIMIAEWMGFYLLHESMLDSLIVARNRFLKVDGVMLPSSVSLYVCPVEMKAYNKEKFDFWEDVYGFDFSPLVPMLKYQTQPIIRTLSEKQLLAEAQLVINLDMAFVEQSDVKAIRINPKFIFTKNSLLHGFACWFDADFDADTSHSLQLSTSPMAEPTHWEQTVIMLPDTFMANKGDTLDCQLELIQDTVQHRRYNITIQLKEEEEGELDGEMEFQDDIRQQLIKAMED